MTEPVALPHAEVEFRNGRPYAPAYRDMYGPGPAQRQTESVFMAGNGLPERWRGRRRFVIVETGFGGGHNFLATWAAWRADPDRSDHLAFVSFERHPWRSGDLRQSHVATPHAGLADALLDQWPLPCRGPHLRHFDAGRVSLLLWFDDALSALSHARIPFDAAYLDGFSPDRNPDLWTEALLGKLATQARPGATLASFSVAAIVRERLQALGAQVERVPGQHKRVVLRGRWNDGVERRSAAGTPQRVAVMGAGLAGISVARALAREGVAVTVHDPAVSVAAGASGAPRMVVRPWLAKATTPASLLSRIGFLHAVSAYRDAPAWHACGVLQRSKPDESAARLRTALRDQGWPAALMAPLPASIGDDPDDPVDTFHAPLGGALDPGAWCTAQLQHPNITLALGDTPSVSTLRNHADAVVLACAGAVGTALDRTLPLSTTQGQITVLENLAVEQVTCGDGYVAPAGHCTVVGATYERGQGRPVHDAAHAENLSRLLHLTDRRADASQIRGGWRGQRAAWPDRLPAVGPVPTMNGVWMVAGLASRGAVWAPLLGEVLTAELLGLPIPLPVDLLSMLQPDRVIRMA